MPTTAHTDPHLAGLRGHPSFQGLMRAAGMRARPRRTPSGLVLVLALVLGSCADVQERPEESPGAPAQDSVAVVFTRGEAPEPVWRPVRASADRLTAALTWLLQGPTPEERAAGVGSWFSPATAGALRSATVDAGGHAVVDFRDLPALIPSASSSTGSTMLLMELDGTVFGVPGVRAVEYRVDGSCERFWNWLQYDCHAVERPGG